MKALSLWQPWASLMAEGAKKIETRGWKNDYRGLVAIHASKTWNSELRTITMQPKFNESLRGVLPESNKVDSLPRGCFIAVGKLHRVLSTTTHAPAIPSMKTDEFWFGDYSENRFMWVFDGVWKLSTPLFSRGYQALWDVPQDVAELMISLLPEEAQELIRQDRIE